MCCVTLGSSLTLSESQLLDLPTEDSRIMCQSFNEVNDITDMPGIVFPKKHTLRWD